MKDRYAYSAFFLILLLLKPAHSEEWIDVTKDINIERLDSADNPGYEKPVLLNNTSSETIKGPLKFILLERASTYSFEPVTTTELSVVQLEADEDLIVDIDSLPEALSNQYTIKIKRKKIVGKGWTLLTDGTVRHNKTGYNWHRKIGSPGILSGEMETGNGDNVRVYPDASPWAGGQLTITEYIANLNSGVYGTDAENGNAGYTDWRAPTIEELSTTIDYAQSSPPFSNIDESGNSIAMVSGEPLFFCLPWNNDGTLSDCEKTWSAYTLITNNKSPLEGTADSQYFGMELEWFDPILYNRNTGAVWPIRGEK